MHREILKVKDYWPPLNKYCTEDMGIKRDANFLEKRPDSLTITKGDVKMYRNNISEETFHCRWDRHV